MRLIALLILIFGISMLPAQAGPLVISTDADARAYVDSDEFQNSTFSDRVSMIDAVIDNLPEQADPVIWARLTEKKIYALTAMGNYALAGDFLADIEERFFKLADGEDFYLSALASGAFIYSYSGNFEKALEYTERAQKSEAYKTDTEQRFRLTTPLASIYVNVGYAELGAELLIEFYENNKDVEVGPKLKFGLVSNIAYALNQAGQFEKSLEYLAILSDMIDTFEAEDELSEIEVKQLRWHYLSNVARNRIDLDQFENLSGIATELETLSSEVGSPLLQLRSRYVKAASLFGEGKHEDAVVLLEALIAHAEEINSIDLIVDYRKLQVLVLKKLSRSAEALTNLEALVEATARLDSEQGRARLQYLNAQLSLQQKNFEIAELKTNQAISTERRKRERITTAILLGCVLVFAVLAVSLYFSLRKSRLLAAELAVREEEAVRAADVKSRFLANMSHEIRTPLNALLGITQVLKQKPLEPDVKNSVSIMSDFGQMLLSIVNDILDLSKIDAGKMKIVTSRTSVQSLLDELLLAWSPRLEEKGLRFDVTPANDVPAVEIDPMRVRQCLNNLVSNAVKFTDSGRVAVSTAYDPSTEMLRFDVEDSGIGIPPEHIENLFEAFEQEDNSAARQVGGTGLGLSIVRTLSELMGGRVHLESVPGQGTRVCLCIHAPAAEAVPASSVPAPQDSSKKIPPSNRLDGQLKFLVVDDHAVNRMIISAFLNAGCAVIKEAECAQEALDILNADPDYDCVLLDNRMPVMDGAELIKVIRTSNAAYRDIRIIFITADAMEGDKEKYLNLGANGYVSKPIIREQLIEEIQRVTG